MNKISFSATNIFISAFADFFEAFEKKIFLAKYFFFCKYYGNQKLTLSMVPWHLL